MRPRELCQSIRTQSQILLESEEDKEARKRRAVTWASRHLAKKSIEDYFQFVRCMVSRYDSLLVFNSIREQPQERRAHSPTKEALAILGRNALRSLIKSFDFTESVTHTSFENVAREHIRAALTVYTTLWADAAPKKNENEQDQEPDEIEPFELMIFRELQKMVSAFIAKNGSDRLIHVDKLLPVAAFFCIEESNHLRLLTRITHHSLLEAHSMLTTELQVRHIAVRLNSMLASALTEYVWRYNSSPQYFRVGLRNLVLSCNQTFDSSKNLHTKKPPTE